MKRLAAVILAGMMALSLAACGGQEDFDAKGYVEGVLDATYRGEYAKHAEDVGESEEAVREELEGNNLDIARSALSVSGINATDEEIDEYVNLILDGYRMIEYEVQEAVKDEDDNFTVDVIVTPVGLLDDLEAIFTEKLTEAVKNGVDESGYMAVFNESVKESIANAKTYDPQTVTLHVTYTEDADGNHVYEVNETDLTKLDQIATNTAI